MVDGRKRKSKTIPLAIGNDPALWRYSSLQDALAANTDLIARLIRVGEAQSAYQMMSDHSPEIIQISENV